MKRLRDKLIVCWMVACTAHLPFPVCDGDTVGSHAPKPGMSCHDPMWIDIDFILLGCDEPDDTDDGPFDDDPERGDYLAGPFPVYVGSLHAPILRTGTWRTYPPAPWCLQAASRSAVPCGATDLGDCGVSISPFARTVSGSSAVMRC